jgi:hypothetical protein
MQSATQSAARGIPIGYLIRVYEKAGNVICGHKERGDFKSGDNAAHHISAFSRGRHPVCCVVGVLLV